MTRIGPNHYRFRLTKDGTQHSVNFKGTETSAKKAHTAFLTDIYRGEIGNKENMSFAQLAQLVIDHYVKPNLRYQSQLIYLNSLNKHILPVLGNKKLGKIKPFHIQELVSNMHTQGFKRTTIEHIRTCINVCFKQAIKWGFITRNPCAYIDLPRTEMKAPQELISAEEINRLIMRFDTEKNLMHKTIFYLGIFCGLRNSEIRALTLDDVDFHESSVRVNKQQGSYLEDGEVKMGAIPPKSRSSYRTVYAPQFVMDTIKEYILTSPYIPASKELFFNVRTGRPITRSGLSKWFRYIVRSEGFPPIRFHDLRHIHATLLVHSGVIDKTAAKRLGHSKVSMTKDVYAHNLDFEDRRAVDQIENYIEMSIKKG
jgi:integrase